MRDACLQQVQRARDIDIDKSLRRVSDDIGLVQRARMDDRLDTSIRKNLHHQQAVGDRSDDVSMSARCRVQPDHLMPRRLQPRRDMPPQPAR